MDSKGLYLQIDPAVKEKAGAILEAIGFDINTAVNVFLRQVIIKRGLPFKAVLPKEDFCIMPLTEKSGCAAPNKEQEAKIAEMSKHYDEISVQCKKLDEKSNSPDNKEIIKETMTRVEPLIQEDLPVIFLLL